MADIDNTLIERGSRYGKFSDHARISQALEDIARAEPGWKRLSPAQKESLKLQWHKQARILNGDPNYADSWVDIAGYSKLIVDELAGEEKGTPSEARNVNPVIAAVAPAAPFRPAIEAPTIGQLATVVPTPPGVILRPEVPSPVVAPSAPVVAPSVPSPVVPARPTSGPLQE